MSALKKEFILTWFCGL